MSLVLAFTAAILGSGEPRFERHDIDAFPAGYQAAVPDMNEDGKPDVVALSTDADRVDWYENVPAPLRVGSRLELFADRTLIEESRGVESRLHSPVPREVVFQFDAAWEGAMSAYVTVLQDGSRFRMYYRGGGETTEEVTCLAESDDGVRWSRPSLGLFEFRGSRENNIVYRGRRKAYWESHNFTPFIDSSPAARPEERYKAVGLGRHVKEDGEDVKALCALVSADGIRWRLLREKPIITKGGFDSQNVAFWDSVLGKYVCYLRAGRDGKRSVMRATSSDFVQWKNPEWLEFDDAPLEHFYTNAISPYFREPRWYLGFPMRFVPERKTIGWPERKIDGVSDAVFISSRDGLHFTRTFQEAFIRPGLDPANWGNAHGNNTPAWGLLPTAPGEISIYWCEGYGQVPRVRRGTIRTDGFVSVIAPHAGGELTTKPFTFEGKELVLNYSTSAVGSVQVEIQDADGAALSGHRLGECPPIFGDEVERTVRWKGASDVGRLAGRPVRLRFVLKDAALFSFCFR